MKAFKVKINKANLESYWYSVFIGQEFWCYLEENLSGILQYKAILEGKIPEGGNCTKWINFDDCEVVKESYIRVETETFTTVVEI
jgi:hypothetical protein